jgi:hypothetical protein
MQSRAIILVDKMQEIPLRPQEEESSQFQMNLCGFELSHDFIAIHVHASV